MSSQDEELKILKAIGRELASIRRHVKLLFWVPVIGGLIVAAVMFLTGCNGGDGSSESSCAGAPAGGTVSIGCLRQFDGACRCEVWSQDCNGTLLDYLHDCTGDWSLTICDHAEACPPR